MDNKNEKQSKPFFKRSELIIALITILLLILIIIIRYFVLAYGSVPEIELIGDSEITLDLNEKYTDPGVKATLNNKDVTKKVEVEGKVDTSKVGNYYIVYSVKNDKNTKKRSVSRNIVILDNVKPAITLRGSGEYFVGIDSKYKEPGYVAIDNVDGNITKKVKVKSNVNTNKLGSYEVKYTVEDTSGNKIEKTRVVRVIDNTKPILNLIGKTTMHIDLHAKYNEAGYNAHDNIDGDLTNKVSVSGSVNPHVVGVYIIRYTVKDKMNNTTTKTRTVHVGNQADQDRATNIQISIANQRLHFYKNNKLIITSSVVTGLKNKHDTPRGTYRILSKSRNTYLTGPGYRSYVNYWMPINSRGVGLHDASWRSNFGGSIYINNGSHGCINLPFNVAKIIYENASVGTKVSIY